MALSDREFREWKAAHPGAEVEATSIAYSAGGIWPCIVGTALLVVGSMILALGHRNQQRDLSERIQPERPLHSSRPDRDSQSGRRAVDRVRPFRFWVVRHFLRLERFAHRRLVHARPDGAAGDHHRERRIAARRAAGFARRFARARREQMADDPQKCAALRDARNSDFIDPRHRARRGRDRADHVHRGLRHEG